MKVLGTENTSAANPPFSRDLIATDYPIHSRKKKTWHVGGASEESSVHTNVQNDVQLNNTNTMDSEMKSQGAWKSYHTDPARCDWKVGHC